MTSASAACGRAQAMVLAAGRGERMRPLTDLTPKPLLDVRGKPLLQWHLDALLRAGWHQALINTAWLGEQIPARFGARWPAQAGLFARVRDHNRAESVLIGHFLLRSIA